MQPGVIGGARRALLGLAVGILVGGPGLGAAPAGPPAIRVLLLPALDTTPEAAHMLPARQFAIRRPEESAFLTRGFVVLGETLAARAAGHPPVIDLADPARRGPRDLDQLGQRAGADWVVSLVVRDAKMEAAHGDGPGGRFTVASRLLVQVRDAAHHAWLSNGDYTGRVDGKGSPIFVFKESLEAATTESLTALLAGYPQTVTVSGDGRLVDYLAGQTAPVAGRPGTVFTGPSSGVPAP